MITNCDITVMNRRYDKETRMDTWNYTPVKGVLWEENQKADAGKGGMEKSNRMTVFIPFLSVNSDFVITIGDKIGKGIVSEPEKGDGCITVTGIETFDYGSKEMQHWEVTGQ